MNKERFPIGFWSYTDIEKHPVDAASVQDWLDAGMTLTQSPDYEGAEPEQVDKIQAILDAAHEKSIRLILCDRRLRFRRLPEVGEDVYRSDMQHAAKTFGNHPALFGFFAGDEPGREDFDDACRAVRIHKELSPGLTPFLNLLPWFGNVHPRVGFASWANYLDAYVKRSGTTLLCYDCYSQMNAFTEWEWDMYFRNLNEHQAASQRHGITFWTTPLAVGHFNYRCPREDDLRWQLNTAVAHGAKGIMWFFFYMREPLDNYRVAPIDEHWERTETFEWLSRVCRTFLKTRAPVIMDLTLENVSHIGKAWGGTAMFEDRTCIHPDIGHRGKGLVSKATSSTGTPLIISEFRHRNGDSYVMVVNNSQTDNTNVAIWFRGQHLHLFRIGWEGREIDLAQEYPDQLKHGDDYFVAGQWFAPGQMELYRVMSDDPHEKN